MSRCKVLIVDDEADVVELLGYRLKRMGCEVLKAYDGEEGLEISQKESPDLILLDIKLPKLDGLEVCTQLKANPQTQHIPIVLISASSEQIEKVKQDGKADGFLKKPFEPEDLFKMIEPFVKAA